MDTISITIMLIAVVFTLMNITTKLGQLIEAIDRQTEVIKKKDK